MRIILDSNIWISFLLGFQQEFVRRVLTDTDLAVYVCPQLLDEIKDVASRAKIKDRLKEGDVDDVYELSYSRKDASGLLGPVCYILRVNSKVSHICPPALSMVT